MDDRAPGEQAAARRRRLQAIGLSSRSAGSFGSSRRQSTIGAMLTSRDFGASSNRVASADLRLRLGDNWVVDGQAIASRTTRRTAATQSGPAFVTGWTTRAATSRFNSGYADRSEGFRTELGFFRRVDIRQWENDIQYKWFPKDSALLSWGPSFEATVTGISAANCRTGRPGRRWSSSSRRARRFTWVRAGRTSCYEGIGFDKHSFRVFTETEWLKWLSGMFAYNQGPQINYYPAQGLPFLGRRPRGGGRRHAAAHAVACASREPTSSTT